MPVHDRTRVLAGTFHDFDPAWIAELRNALNAGLQPEGYYALVEQVAGSPHPDVLTLEEHRDPGERHGTRVALPGSALAVAEHPPKVRFTLEAEATLCAVGDLALDALEHLAWDSNLDPILRGLAPMERDALEAVP
jgi:hypothetical protein